VPGIGPAWNDEADHAVYLAWARLQLLLGQPAKALAVIQPMLAVAEQHRLHHRIIELYLIGVQALHALDQKELCWQSLRTALQLAEQHGYLRILDRNPDLAWILSEPKSRGISPHYIRRVLEIGGEASRFPETNSAGRPQPAKEGLIEPLSNREKDVLILMAEGLSNPEIAARLFLSPNTLKAHTQHIFGKLGVHNRIQAIRKARELNILE
jgi:LuxR family maltose regulon positive regulatory protein